MAKRNFCPIGQNNLILTAPDSSRAALEAHLKPVDLTQGMLLHKPDERPSLVCFPTSGVGSMIALGRSGRRMEVGMFGNDGMSATSVIMGAESSPTETLMQVPGEGLAIDADTLRDLLSDMPELRLHLMLYVQTLFIQASMTALSNGHAKLEERLARWLLMCHDRISGNTLALTHEYMAVMLGVRRAGVTVGTHRLEGKGLIRAERGSITILDRSGLEKEAQISYGVPEAEYLRLLGRRS